MKFALTITEATPSELSALLVALGGSTDAIAYTAPAATDEADDNNAPVNASAPAVDVTGLPHDERIHSKAKTVTEAGAWRKRKGVADATVAAVEAELRARSGGIPSPLPIHQPPVPQPSPMPPQPVGGYPTGPGYPPQPGNVVAQPFTPPAAQPMPPMPAQPAAPMPPMPDAAQPGPLAATMPYQPPQPPAPAAIPADFNSFMQTLTAKMQQPSPDGNGMLVDAEYLQRIKGEIAAGYNTALNVITDIAPYPHMIAYAVQLMTRDGKW